MEDQSTGKGRDVGVPPFKTPTLNKGMLWAIDSIRDGYHPKMLLFALDKLFYIYAQVKNSGRVDDKLTLAYEILCISTNCCTNRRNGIEKTGILDTLTLLNVEDMHHLKTSHGWCMMAYCWWAHGRNFWVMAPGARCWLGCSNTSTGAMTMQPIARHRC